MITRNQIDFNKANEVLGKSETAEELKERFGALTQLIDANGLRGFFQQKTVPNPTGIVLDYDVEEVKREIGDTKRGS